ncbi:carbohydrate ABC transporter permease [Virgibacillus dakarensis]|uniref:carbohydrate ABC transporter permease n=1 Tax=Virgibacillus dakarensis TaxID=1917889 RepID=UPI001F2338AE|nr:sugar ABC transporter permease [Virgibacillus dakarensis]
MHNIDYKKKSKLNPHLKRNYIWAYIFILPQILYFLGASLYPIIMSYVYSFFDWAGVGPLEDFIGFDNYKELLEDPQFWGAFFNTLIYTIGFTFISTSVSLILALVLNEVNLKGKGFYRTIYFLPVVTTTAIVGIIMQNIFGIDGLVNQVLEKVNLISQPVPWLVDPVLAMIVLIVVGSWKSIGITMVYWLTGLQTIPNDLYEAAKIDGAGYWTTLRYITLPLLKPITAVIFFLAIISSMQVFDLVKTLTDGGPFYSTETLELYIYRYAFASELGGSRVGFASAAGVILGIFVFLVSIGFALLGWIAKRKGNALKGVNSL